MLLGKLAVRNLLRNRRRTLLNGLLIALSVAALFLLNGYANQTYLDLEDQYIENAWHLQITVRGYWDEHFEDYRYILPADTLRRLSKILQGEKAVQAVAFRLDVRGLVGTNRRSLGAALFGFDPDNAPRWIAEVDEGRALEPQDREAVVLTRRLADSLGLGVGDHLIVLTTTVTGALNTGTLRIVGLYDSSGQYGVVPLSFVRRLLQTDGAERVYVRLADSRGLEEAAERLQALLAANGLTNLEVKTWKELADLYWQVKSYLGTLFLFVSAVLFGVVFFSVFEALTMAFFERIREIGTIRAIGTERAQVFGIFLLEGLLIGLLGGLGGLVLGTGIGAFVNGLGLTYVPPPASGPIPFRIALGPEAGGGPLLVVLLATLLSTLYPAWRAARIEVVEALRAL